MLSTCLKQGYHSFLDYHQTPENQHEKWRNIHWKMHLLTKKLVVFPAISMFVFKGCKVWFVLFASDTRQERLKTLLEKLQMKHGELVGTRFTIGAAVRTSGKQSWLENRPGMKMVCPIENRDIPASYVSLPEGNLEDGD